MYIEPVSFPVTIRVSFYLSTAGSGCHRVGGLLVGFSLSFDLACDLSAHICTAELFFFVTLNVDLLFLFEFLH